MRPNAFVNSALLQEETLLNVCLVLEQGWPAGPSFLHALNTLIETTVLHEHVYFDPLGNFDRTDLNPESTTSLIRDSSIVQLLLGEDAIERLPNRTILDQRLEATGTEYRSGDFLVDAFWTPHSFMYGSPEDEPNRLKVYLDLTTKEGKLLLEPRQLVSNDVAPGFAIGGGEELALMLLGRSLQFNKEDLIQLEGINRHAKADLDLTRHLGLNLHPYCLALPHQLGAVHHQNSTTLKLYRKILEHMDSKESREDDEVGRTAFTRARIPALSELVLARCKDSAAAIGLEILNLRQEQKGFRSYLTEFEKALTVSRTKRERWKLQGQFDAALKTLLEREDKQSTRFIYRLWDVIKEPTKILAALGDKIAVVGKEKYIVGRARGLHDFWDGLAQGPPHAIAREQFRRLFQKRAEDRTWELAEKLARALENTMMQDEPAERGRRHPVRLVSGPLADGYRRSRRTDPHV